MIATKHPISLFTVTQSQRVCSVYHVVVLKFTESMQSEIVASDRQLHLCGMCRWL